MKTSITKMLQVYTDKVGTLKRHRIMIQALMSRDKYQGTPDSYNDFKLVELNAKIYVYNLVISDLEQVINKLKENENTNKNKLSRI